MRHLPELRRTLLALATTLSAAPIAAEPQMVVSGQQPPVIRESVSFTDLDLRHANAQQQLRWRIKEAADRVCEKAEGPNPQMGVPGYGHDDPWLTCADLTYAVARPQIQSAIDRAKAGKQVAIALVIAAPRTR